MTKTAELLELERKNRILEQKLTRCRQNRIQTEDVKEKNDILAKRIFAELNDVRLTTEIQKRELEESTRDLRKINKAMLEAQQQLTSSEQKATIASRAKSRLLANVSHELRTPLNAVMGMANLLGESDLDLPQKELTRIIWDSAQSLLVMLNNVLEAARLDTTAIPLNIKTFSLESLNRRILELYAIAAEDKELEIVGFLDDKQDIWIDADFDRLQQVLMNIVGNAIKFTERGHVSVRIGVSPMPVVSGSMEWQLVMQVIDTGIGFDLNRKEELFSAFAQGDDSLNRVYGGVGLGLAISNDLVRQMGGSIDVFRTSDNGTKMEVVVPVVGMRSTRRMSIDQPMTAFICMEPTLNSEALERELSMLDVPVHLCANLQDLKSGLSQLTAAETVFVFFDDRFEQGIAKQKESHGGDGHTSRIHLVRVKPFTTRASIHAATSDEVFSTLYLPLRRAELEALFKHSMQDRVEKTPQPPAMIGDSKERAVSKGKVLIVDDNSTNQKVASLMVQRLGYDVQIVDSGKHVLALIGATRFDIVLMDCQMPEMDGFETTRKLRSREGLGQSLSATGRVAVIAMTATTFKQKNEDPSDAGMDDVIYKPLRTETLRSVLTTWVPGSNDDVS